MQFTTIFGETIDSPCAGCVVIDSNKFKEGRIFQTKLWDLSQDFEIAYPGMMVISPMRHVSNYMDLTDDEINELHKLMVLCKKAVGEIFNCNKMTYMFYEKPDGHIHFVIIPLHDLVKIQNKYSVLGELMGKAQILLKDKENMQQVIKAIQDLKKYFAKVQI